MLGEFTVEDDYEDEDSDDENANFDSDYLKNYVFKPDKEYMYRCQKALTELRNSLKLEGIRPCVIDSLFKEGLKVLLASCFVDTYLKQELPNFPKIIAILRDEAREREARIRIVEKRFESK